MNTALRRFYKIAKGLLHRISLCGSSFSVCVRPAGTVYFWQEKCYDTP